MGRTAARLSLDGRKEIVGDAEMKRAKINPERRASYKETARMIVGADRSARRYGASQNTIGEIERALVAAFLDGCKQAAAPATETEELTWIQIPSRSRNTLSSMTFWFSTRIGRGEGRVDRIEVFERNGKSRWSIIDANGERQDHSVADGSVRHLIRLGLIEPSPDDANIYELTEQGLQLCRDYWARSDVNDPTLPKISLR